MVGMVRWMVVVEGWVVGEWRCGGGDRRRGGDIWRWEDERGYPGGGDENHGQWVNGWV